MSYLIEIQPEGAPAFYARFFSRNARSRIHLDENYREGRVFYREKWPRFFFVRLSLSKTSKDRLIRLGDRYKSIRQCYAHAQLFLFCFTLFNGGRSNIAPDFHQFQVQIRLIIVLTIYARAFVEENNKRRNVVFNQRASGMKKFIIAL